VEARRVLLLHAFGHAFSPWSDIAGSFREELVKKSPEPIDLFEISLDVARNQSPQDDTHNKYTARVWIHGKLPRELSSTRATVRAADHILSMVINKFSTARRCNLLISRIPLDEFAVRALIHVVANIFRAFGKRGHAFRATTTPFAGFKILPCPLWVTPMRRLYVNSCFGL
jgi:hypothetical protein